MSSDSDRATEDRSADLHDQGGRDGHERAGHGEPEPEPEVDERIQLLRLLATGCKDETAARRLGISVRTLRRRVAGLMAELGVGTRLQLGAEAVRRHLL